jgi:hypothetical protein
MILQHTHQRTPQRLVNQTNSHNSYGQRLSPSVSVFEVIEFEVS